MSKPYITEDDVLVIPTDCEPEYRWWAGGQSIAKTLIELGASEHCWKLYSHEDYPEELQEGASRPDQT
ncbi:hypothetical protein [Desulfobaculum bizertense]|uniref:Uncharacterized protein n=1 Tax=Desulfobaculum bizertense DSM 18034 TaxID=1121442 RepID=A0A1T4VJM5_9BACT|nr:hypothetical protein [Desulfobaculum bizertense]UIJ37986.1 hypothetical protein LWC08_15065 [Desulfobaculum bizertense]UIJ38013.1 hypothetical protein LWC08_00145 [Desulfobaculum bizertense]SKA65123.1 hypothetical protein SAMN02745702_00473 [Desulfobaculum bizertense DSM 18034]